MKPLEKMCWHEKGMNTVKGNIPEGGETDPQ